MDWTECPQAEIVPGKMGGRPVIKGTRIEPDTIVIDEDLGPSPEQAPADFPAVPLDAILKSRAFTHQHQLAA